MRAAHSVTAQQAAGDLCHKLLELGKDFALGHQYRQCSKLDFPFAEADPVLADNENNTALHAACKGGALAVVQVRRLHDLHSACIHPLTRCAVPQALVTAKAEVGARNALGWLPVHEACKAGQAEVRSACVRGTC